MNFQMKSTVENDTLVVTLEGELTRASIDSFKEYVIERFEQADYNVAIQCEHLTYVDSAGLGSFIYLRKITHDRNKQFYLTSVTGWLRKFLEVTGLESTLTTCHKE